VKTTLEVTGFRTDGTPALHQGNEPCQVNDPYVPGASDDWVALSIRAGMKPYLNIRNNDGRAYTLNIPGYGPAPSGNIRAGSNKTTKFQLPSIRGQQDPKQYGKYVLQYTLVGTNVVRTIVIWVVYKN
jgi:hypothetical protein